MVRTQSFLRFRPKERLIWLEVNSLIENKRLKVTLYLHHRVILAVQINGMSITNAVSSVSAIGGQEGQNQILLLITHLSVQEC